MMKTDRAVALQIVDSSARHASLDEIVEQLWAWRLEHRGSGVSDDAVAASWLNTDPVRLVDACRSARQAAVLGISRDVARSVIAALPDQASMDEIVDAVGGWCWPDEPAE